MRRMIVKWIYLLFIADELTEYEYSQAGVILEDECKGGKIILLTLHSPEQSTIGIRSLWKRKGKLNNSNIFNNFDFFFSDGG